uniref:5-hydroxytryptamine receptor 3A n=1 Tax=Leptobrachium leishanense TaxID=445787 RepID=A0A8C5MMB3_9ANUR
GSSIKPFLRLDIMLAGRVQQEKVCSFHDVLKNLTDAMSVSVRPTKHWEEPSEVYLSLVLYSIINLDWKNDFLSWDPNEYCGIEDIVVPYSKFWKPDLYIEELTESNENQAVIPYFRFGYDGLVIHERPLRLLSSCNLNIFNFPFDIQSCTLTFYSYIYGEEINLFARNSNAAAEFSQVLVVSKGEWSLLNIKVHEIPSAVRYEIFLKRSPVKYIMNLIIPAILMVIADVFSMFIHSYPDRLNFKITVVLGFFVLLLILNDMLPNSDSPPIIGIFCCSCMAMMIFTIIGTMLAAYMMDMSFKKVCFDNTQTTKFQDLLFEAMLHLLVLDVQTQCEYFFLIHLYLISTDRYNDNKKEINLKTPKKKKRFHRNVKINMEIKLLKKILAGIVKIHDQWNTNVNDNTESEWYTAALAVDRLFFIFYLVFVIIMFIFLFLTWCS